MLEADAKAQIAVWRSRKKAQWDRISTAMSGLQMVEYGEEATTFMLTYSTDAFYESVIMGRLPQVHIERYGPRTAPKHRKVMEAKKPAEKQGIDLTDEQLDDVLSRWARKRSALELSFINHVWGRDGVMNDQIR